MKVGRLCSRSAYLADPDETVQVAAKRMKEEKVGTLIVIDAERSPVGIVTDRDLVTRVLAESLDPRKTRVDHVMTSHPRTVRESAPIEEAVATMRVLGVRRMPVVDRRGHLVGIVSVDDVLELVTEELDNLGRIVGASRPGASELTVRPGRARPRPADTQGLERSAADLEC